MTFYEHRILLLKTMSLSMREKQYTIAGLCKKCVLKHDQLPQRKKLKPKDLMCKNYTFNPLFSDWCGLASCCNSSQIWVAVVRLLL